MTYSKPKHIESGCKVSRYYYENRNHALVASVMARQEAEKLAQQGYDFGYCSPGHMELMTEGPYKGLYMVMIP